MKRQSYILTIEVADQDADLLDEAKVANLIVSRLYGTATHFVALRKSYSSDHLHDPNGEQAAQRISRPCDHEICERIGEPGVFTPTDDELEVITSCGVARGIIDPKKVDTVKYILKEWTK